jgi:hypothetical protein
LRVLSPGKGEGGATSTGGLRAPRKEQRKPPGADGGQSNRGDRRLRVLNGRGLAGQLMIERSEELAEGLGVEGGRLTFRSRTNGRPMERSDCIVLAIYAECNEADKGARDDEGGVANLLSFV